MNLLVCDDDLKLCNYIAEKLVGKFNIMVAQTKQQALEIVSIQKIDVLIIDYFLKDGNGFDVVSDIRKHNQLIKIILISGAATKEIAIKSINFNINSLIEKPFTIFDLQSALEKISNDVKYANKIKFNLDERNLTAQINEIRFSLTPIEYKILYILLDNTHRRVSRNEISKLIWGAMRVSENSFDTHLGNIKKKMCQYSSILTNVKGVGYALDL